MQADEPRLAEMFRSTPDAHQFNSPYEYVAYLRSLQIELTPQSAASQAFRLWMPYTHCLLAMEWMIIVADVSQEPAYFITSDCPVCIHGPKPFEGEHGILQPDVQLSLPLTPTMALYAAWPGPNQLPSAALTYAVADRHEITVTNVRTAMYGRKYLIAHKPNLASALPAEEVWQTSRLTFSHIQ
jgi:hypothetical protein